MRYNGEDYTGQIVAFVRYKLVKGRKYYQLVRNYRENGSHRQQVLCHLGQHRSLDEAINHERSMVSNYLGRVVSQEKEAESTREYLLETYRDRFTDGLPSLREAYMQPWIMRRSYEEDILKSIVDYYDAIDNAERNRNLAEEHQGQLDKYLAVKHSYG